MNKIVSILATVAFFFSLNVSAQQEPVQKKKKAKTEKSCTAQEKNHVLMKRKKDVIMTKKADVVLLKKQKIKNHNFLL